MTRILKNSLSQALVSFYALASEVTELKCGAVIVACTLDHRIANAYSRNMFLVAWAEMAQFKTISLHPSFQRSLLNPCRPGCWDASLEQMYMPMSTLPQHADRAAPKADLIINRIYYVTAKNIAQLQDLASSGGYRRTKLELLGAYLWKIVAKRETSNTKRCKMGVAVEGRTILGDENNSMANYFGNVISLPFGVERVEELVTKSLSWVADAVHEYVHAVNNQEHFLGLIDWVEAHRPKPLLGRIYCKVSEDESMFVVSSGRRFPVGKVDFGWGRPVFGSYYFPPDGEDGYVMPMPSVGRGSDVAQKDYSLPLSNLFFCYMVMSSAGEPELLCNDRGVNFMEAYADVELREMQLYNPDASVEGMLVAEKKDRVLCVQVSDESLIHSFPFPFSSDVVWYSFTTSQFLVI
ncbi:hypothetical protein AAC387_Pa07g0464 [Persea americana]